jgi:hypothetical protein
MDSSASATIACEARIQASEYFEGIVVSPYGHCSRDYSSEILPLPHSFTIVQLSSRF